MNFFYTSITCQIKLKKEFYLYKTISEKKLLKIAYLNSVHGTIDLLIFSIFVEHNIDLSLVVKQINFLKNSKIPIFPIDADYLKSQYGFSESVELGIALKKLKKFWINQNFRIDKKEIKKILKIK